MARTLAMAVNESEDDWDVHLLHSKLVYNSSVSAATGLVPNDAHMGGPSRLPLTVFVRTGVAGH